MKSRPSESYESPVTPLQRRSIEVEIADAFHSILIERLGEDTARAILQEVVARLAEASAAQIRAEHPRPGLDDMWEIWKGFADDDRLEIHLDELSETRLRFHVNRCEFAEMYIARNRVRTGLVLSCKRDAHFACALIPGVRFEQSQTILEGAPQCTITYTLEDQ